jgi:hypothetical protein
MPGRLIISLDCEGKWGVADRGAEYMSFIGSARLQVVYEAILDLFERHQLPASFAFVSALCLGVDELLERLPRTGLWYAGRNWLEGPFRALNAGVSDGWCAPGLVQAVLRRGRHHICSHGGTHLPLSDQMTPTESAELDLRFARIVHERLGLDWSCIVFPRNIVGHLDVLAAEGLSGFRDMDPQEKKGGMPGKIVRLCNELISWDRRDLLSHSSPLSSPMPLSPGKFLNAKIGARKLIGVSVTRRRIESLLKFAVKNDATLHLYTHPHNFISDASMFDKLDALLGASNYFSRRHGLRVMTMKEELYEARS